MSEPVLPQFEQLRPDSCSECGLCCRGIGSPVLLYQSRKLWAENHPHRPEGLPEELVAEIDRHFAGLFRGQEPQDQCLWYDPETRACQHYEWRPQVCIDYELAGRECQQLRKLYVLDAES